MSVSDPGKKIEWGADSEPRKNARVPSSGVLQCEIKTNLCINEFWHREQVKDSH